GRAEVTDIPCVPNGTQVTLAGTTGVASINGLNAGSTSEYVSFTESDFGNPQPVGSSLSLQTALENLLPPVLSPFLDPLDDALNSVLTTLGVRLGSMDMIVHGVRCNTPTLVL